MDEGVLKQPTRPDNVLKSQYSCSRCFKTKNNGWKMCNICSVFLHKEAVRRLRTKLAILFAVHIVNKPHEKTLTNIECILLTTIVCVSKPDMSYSFVPWRSTVAQQTIKNTSVHTAVYFDSSCCLKYSLESKMWIYLQLSSPQKIHFLLFE